MDARTCPYGLDYPARNWGLLKISIATAIPLSPELQFSSLSKRHNGTSWQDIWNVVPYSKSYFAGSRFSVTLRAASTVWSAVTVARVGLAVHVTAALV